MRFELAIAPNLADQDGAGAVAALLGAATAPRSRPAVRFAPMRFAPVRLVWHDTGDAALARRNLILVEHRTGHDATMRLERLGPDEDPRSWSPAAAGRVLWEAADLSALRRQAADVELPDGLVAIAGFEGQSRALALSDGAATATATVLTGTLRAVAGERPAGRVLLAGDRALVADRARTLARALPVGVAPAALAAEAYAVAGIGLPPRRLGAPGLPAGCSATFPAVQALDFIVSHLADVILHHAPGAIDGIDPEPVHQMRVAMRRLRSALQLLGRAADRPDLPDVKAGLKSLAHRLGPARDWDVFTRGTLRAAIAAFPDEPALGPLAGAAQRRRDSAYAALASFLEGPAFRQLGVSLALLCPGPAEGEPPEGEPAISGPPGDEPSKAEPSALREASPSGPDGAPDGAAPDAPAAPGTASPAPAGHPARTDLKAFAAEALGKRRKRLRAAGRTIHELRADELHAIRLDAKRLRYVAEFFAPLYPGHAPRRFVRRLAALQEQLGLLNDGAAIDALLGEIGHARKLAGGIVRGFAAADRTRAREKIDRSWRKFRHQNAFWK